MPWLAWHGPPRRRRLRGAVRRCPRRGRIATCRIFRLLRAHSRPRRQSGRQPVRACRQPRRCGAPARRMRSHGLRRGCRPPAASPRPWPAGQPFPGMAHRDPPRRAAAQLWILAAPPGSRPSHPVPLPPSEANWPCDLNRLVKRRSSDAGTFDARSGSTLSLRGICSAPRQFHAVLTCVLVLEESWCFAILR